jgi:hypothetical protein
MTPSAAANPVVTLHAPANARVGEMIPITIRVENKSAETLELYLCGREPTCDFLVIASDGDVVWRRLEGEIVQAILRLELLAPGQTLELRDSWDQRDNAGEPVAPGAYTIRGTVLSDGSSTLDAPAIPLHIDRP